MWTTSKHGISVESAQHFILSHQRGEILLKLKSWSSCNFWHRRQKYERFNVTKID